MFLYVFVLYMYCIEVRCSVIGQRIEADVCVRVYESVRACIAYALYVHCMLVHVIVCIHA